MEIKISVKDVEETSLNDNLILMNKQKEVKAMLIIFCCHRRTKDGTVSTFIIHKLES